MVSMIAAMDVAISLPLLQFVLEQWCGLQPALVPPTTAWVAPLTAALICWGVMLAYLGLARRLARHAVQSPVRELAIAVVIVLSTLGLAWFFVAWLDGMRLPAFGDLAGSRNQGLAPWIAVLAWNIIIVWRASNMRRRDMTFLGVSLNFRLGTLISIIACTLISLAGGPMGAVAGLVYLWFFIGSGLAATALARVDDKAFIADSETGAVLSFNRAARLMGTAWLTVLVAAVVSIAWSVAGFSRLGAALAPVGRLAGSAVSVAVALLLWLLTPLLLGLEHLVEGRLAPPTPPPPASELAQPWLTQMDNSVQSTGGMSAAITWILIGVAAVVLLALAWWFLRRSLQRGEPEPVDPDDLALESQAEPAVRKSWRDRLPWARRQEDQLLGVDSVQAMYANVTRLARRTGAPRPRSQPPDDYLAALQATFPAHASMLDALTTDYMRAHYGDEPPTDEEFAALREEYERLAQGE